MLTTIDQKLGAIKAINEEKDKVDQDIQVLTALESNNVVTISFETAKFFVDPLLIRHCISIVRQNSEQRRTELIAKAEELMK